MFEAVFESSVISLLSLPGNENTIPGVRPACVCAPQHEHPTGIVQALQPERIIPDTFLKRLLVCLPVSSRYRASMVSGSANSFCTSYPVNCADLYAEYIACNTCRGCCL